MVLSLAGLALAAGAASGSWERTPAGGWRSERADLVRVVVHKRAPELEQGANRPPLPLGPRALAALGESSVDYDGLAIGLLSAVDAAAAISILEREGYSPYVDQGRSIHTMTSTFDPAEPSGRSSEWVGRPETPVALPGLAWVQFAYPIRRTWQDALEACWAEVLDQAAYRTLLVATPDLQALTTCEGVADYLAVVEPVLSFDRTAPDAVDSAGPLEVTLAPRVLIGDVLGGLPPGTRIEDKTSEGDFLASFWAWGEGVGRALLGDGRVVNMVATSDTGGPSDERQALISARQFVDPLSSSGQPIAPTNPSPGVYDNTYKDWLGLQGLYGVGGYQERIAFFDTGIDDGNPNDGSAFHLDLGSRIVSAYNISRPLNQAVEGFNDTIPPLELAEWGVEDRPGHGTHVMSAAIGAGVNQGRPAGGPFFAQGQGIAPEASGVLVKRYKYVAPNCADAPDATGYANGTANMENGHSWAYGKDARIASHSWNNGGAGYDALSNRFERIALDAVGDATSLEPLTIVFSAGNLPAGTIGLGLRNPANAKNVIAVGSVDSYYPGGWTCAGYGAPSGPYTVSEFSPWSNLSGGVHTKRVMPTVVAPGWRVDGARRTSSPCPASTCGQTTIPGPPKYSWTFGTSFSAPAVSGALALEAKRFEDGSHGYAWSYGPFPAQTPHPTLLRAGLVATAQSPGPRDPLTGLIGPCYLGDCRPARYYGWGMLDLERLLDPETDIWVLNSTVAFTAVGQSWSSPWLEAEDPEKEVLIALVWHDIPSPSGSRTQTLKRDLDLMLWGPVPVGPATYHGNNFEENPIPPTPPVDSGYSRAVTAPPVVQVDQTNNVEAIFLRPGVLDSDNRFALTVTDTKHTGDVEFPEQAFSIYAWNVRCWDNDILYNCATFGQ